MSDIFAERPIPRAAIAGAGVLVALTILAAGTARWTGVGTLGLEPAPAVETADLVFRDLPGGAIAVSGAGREEVMEAETNGFVRGVLRGLARDRRVHGVGAEAPFRLILRVDGRLVLEDPATGGAIDLGAYGSGNAAAFRRLLRTP